MNSNSIKYGVNDTSYNTAGKLPGLTQLVDLFFELMDTLPEAQCVRGLYPEDLTEPAKKLTYFLSGWLGGPRIYAENYGEISIPLAHRHLKIGQEESDAWIMCMEKAAEQQPYEESFRKYLIEQLSIPANRIVTVCNQ